MANETEEIRRDVAAPADASDRPRRRGIRAVLSVPLAIVSTVAVTLGIAQPAEAATPQVKRHAKTKAQGSTVHRTASVAAVAPAPAEYVVADGDTVSGIAERFGLATAEILAANGLGWSSLIFPGQRLALPPGAPAADAAPAPLPVAPEIARHVVVEGDTIGGIAATYGLDVASVLSANGLGPSSLIFPGESIVLPARRPLRRRAGAGPAARARSARAHAAVRPGLRRDARGGRGRHARRDRRPLRRHGGGARREQRARRFDRHPARPVARRAPPHPGRDGRVGHHAARRRDPRQRQDRHRRRAGPRRARPGHRRRPRGRGAGVRA